MANDSNSNLAGYMARVLIADDDRDYLEAFREGVELLGHEVTCVSSAVDVRLMLRQKGFDIVFLDVVMPGGGALTLVHQIYSNFPNLPIVVISGQSFLYDTPILQEGLRMARGVLRKTASIAEIDATIRQNAL